MLQRVRQKQQLCSNIRHSLAYCSDSVASAGFAFSDFLQLLLFETQIASCRLCLNVRHQLNVARDNIDAPLYAAQVQIQEQALLSARSARLCIRRRSAKL